ncbi:hypothetical protein L226DRAFT_463960, partial [Lentinus tigrinus ALCF2SS1-7]|uniref:uncharacterized protein n=1 Tax=Lentinus tigrinus ALCF2SS1-7 TaxID=1328758 RepID=UPI001165DFBF
QLHQARLFVIIHMGYIRHTVLFSLLAAANMSGDETDGAEVTHPPVYRIIIAYWQSTDLRNFLWALDAKYLLHWEKPENKRRTGGNPPRVRHMRDECRTIGGVAPVGLWRNCYNEEWLASLDDYEIENLEIQEGNYDFTLDPIPATGGATATGSSS